MTSRFTRSFFCIGLLLISPAILAQPISVSVSIDAATPGVRVAEDFVGFSMEQYTLSTGRWGNLGSFWTGGTSGNGRLKKLLANISSRSTIRLGGFTADDRMVWQNTIRGSSINVRATYQDDTDKFFTFLSEIGWQGIYTINLPLNTPANAVSEATYIANKYINQLHSISLGNEPYGYSSSFRDSTYTPAKFMTTDYLPMYDAIRAANPAIPISGPDCGARQYQGPLNQTWNKTYTDYINNSGSSRPLKALNVHNYGLGNNAKPTSALTREALADTLMNFDNAPLIFSSTLLPYVTTLARNKNVPLRYSETSSSAGVSDGNEQEKIADTFVTSLWVIDYLYTLAKNNISGVNFHSSGGSKYSAIYWGDNASAATYPVGAIYYGLLAFVDGARNQRLLTVTPQRTKSNPRASYYATTSDDSKTMKVTILNKEFTKSISVNLTVPGVTISTVTYQTLKPQSSMFDLATNVTYAGTQVASDGSFTNGSPTNLAASNAISFSVTVAPMTAVVATVTLQGCTDMYTLKSGSWNDPTVWSCGRVPVTADPVRLKHTVTLPASYVGQANRLTIDSGARLIYGNRARLSLTR
jgi:hypothetical protein